MNETRSATIEGVARLLDVKCMRDRGGLGALGQRVLEGGLGEVANGELLELLVGRRISDREALERLGGEFAQTSALVAGDLAAGLGLSGEEAVRVAAAFAMGRRAEQARQQPKPSMQSAEAVFRHLRPIFRGILKESLFAMLLDGKHRLTRLERISEGTLTSSLVHPREVFRPAIREAAAAIVVAHNHPSGDPEPSSEDLEVTRRLLRAGRLVGIPLLDHVVLGETTWVSIRERIAFG
jgi:DNA repair protein RadC